MRGETKLHPSRTPLSQRTAGGAAQRPPISAPKVRSATPPASRNPRIEKRIAAARDFTVWFDMPDAEILVISAQDDVLVPSLRSRKLVDDLCELPRLATMPWGGHACNVTDPETFNRLVLEFLGS